MAWLLSQGRALTEYISNTFLRSDAQQSAEQQSLAQRDGVPADAADAAAAWSPDGGAHVAGLSEQTSQDFAVLPEEHRSFEEAPEWQGSDLPRNWFSWRNLWVRYDVLKMSSHPRILHGSASVRRSKMLPTLMQRPSRPLAHAGLHWTRLPHEHCVHRPRQPGERSAGWRADGVHHPVGAAVEHHHGASCDCPSHYSGLPCLVPTWGCWHALRGVQFTAGCTMLSA